MNANYDIEFDIFIGKGVFSYPDFQDVHWREFYATRLCIMSRKKTQYIFFYEITLCFICFYQNFESWVL